MDIVQSGYFSVPQLLRYGAYPFTLVISEDHGNSHIWRGAVTTCFLRLLMCRFTCTRIGFRFNLNWSYLNWNRKKYVCRLYKAKLSYCNKNKYFNHHFFLGGGGVMESTIKCTHVYNWRFKKIVQGGWGFLKTMFNNYLLLKF